MSQAKPEPRAKPKRFYSQVDVAASGEGFCITLDGKTIKTPARTILQVSDRNVAQKIRDEWDAQREVIDADAMPLTRLASIALDRVPLDRAELIADMVRYCETDLLCYRAPTTEENAVLRARQDAGFDPILAWAARAHGMVLEVTEGISPVVQPAASITRFQHVVELANDSELAALAMMVPLLGSALLALAVWKERLAVEDALRLARLDEDTYAERWGVDAGQAAAWATKARDIRACAFFLTGK